MTPHRLAGPQLAERVGQDVSVQLGGQQLEQVRLGQRQQPLRTGVQGKS